MNVSLLASGSSGNAIYVHAGATRVLVDAGLTGKQVENRLGAIGVDPGALQGIVVSHEHSDHIKGVGVLARRYRIPVLMTQGTLDASKETFRGTERIRVFDNDAAFDFGDLSFQAFAISHDAADPVNFLISDGESQVGIATDMGVVTQLVYQRLKAADLVVMEANYDREMLINGPYPWDLKKRIRSRHGHLSNNRAAEALGNLAAAGVKQAVLAHLSEKNNRPALAKQTCCDYLKRCGLSRFPMFVARQDRPTDIFVI